MSILESNEYFLRIPIYPIYLYLYEINCIFSRIHTYIVEYRDIKESFSLLFIFITSDQNQPFQLNAKTGQITTKLSLDREKISNYSLHVAVHDNHGNKAVR